MQSWTHRGCRRRLGWQEYYASAIGHDEAGRKSVFSLTISGMETRLRVVMRINLGRRVAGPITAALWLAIGACGGRSAVEQNGPSGAGGSETGADAGCSVDTSMCTGLMPGNVACNADSDCKFLSVPNCDGGDGWFIGVNRSSAASCAQCAGVVCSPCGIRTQDCGLARGVNGETVAVHCVSHQCLSYLATNPPSL